ncbi:MAG: tetratricopeptide repeat-containing diguanylate cyclase [Sarcina sp.]
MKIITRFILFFTTIAFLFLCLNKNIALADTITNTPSIDTLLKEINDAESNLSIEKKIELNIEIGNYYYKENQIDNSLKYLGDAVNELMENQNVLQANTVMFQILGIGIEYRRYTVVIQYSLTLLDNLSELYKETGDSTYIQEMIGVDYVVATTCNILGDMVYGQSYFKTGSELESQYYIKETASMDYVKSNYYYYQENYAQAAKYANDGIKISKQENHEEDYLIGLIYLSRVQIRQNELTEAATNLSSVKKSLKTVNSSLIASQYYYYYGYLNEKLGRYNTAINNYLESYNYTKKEKLYDINDDILYRLGNLYSKIGEYQKSVEYYQKYITQEQELSDSKEKVNASIIINMHENDPQNILNEIKIKKSQSKMRILTFLFISLLILAVIILGAYYKKKRNIKKLNSQLNKDLLTKAYNRRYIMSYIQKLKRQRIDFSIAMLDVDNYKKVNDTYGHMFGDIVLTRLVKTINAVAGDKVSVCRYGGEEFLLVFEFEDFESTVKIAKRIIRAIESLEWEYGNVITASCGLTKHSFDNKISKTLEIADKLLYIAKRSGKNRVEY